MSKIKNLKNFLKRFKFIQQANYFYKSLFPHKSELGITSINILTTFPAFIPYSAGSYEERANQTISSIKNFTKCLKRIYALDTEFDKPLNGNGGTKGIS